MAELFEDVPEAIENSVEIARRCSLELKLGKSVLPAYPVPAELSTEDFPARGIAARPAASAWCSSQQRRWQGRAIAQRGIRAAPGDRARRHLPDGLRRLLPDRRRLHPLGARERRAGRAGPRLRRRLAGRVRARHHRPRSAALRPAVRALPESRARLDARLRRRLLHGRPRPRHRIRRAALRPRARLADHHLRHHGREGGGARRRARVRHELRLRRLDREADSVRARHHAQGRAREGRGAARAAIKNEEETRAHPRHGDVARRPGAQRRHARRRRGHRAVGAHRFRAAVLRRDRRTAS